MRITGRIERTEIEIRARRLASAVIAEQARCSGHAHARTDDTVARQNLRERIEALASITEILPVVHALRIASEHACEVHGRWDVDPPSEGLAMFLAMALLGRVLEDTDPAFKAAA